MNKEIKIPTLIGLTVLTIGLGIGVFLTTNQQILKSRASANFEPKNVTIINITDNSTAISWKTTEPTSGFVQAGTTSSLGLTFKDERDQELPQPHLLHFVTLTNLSPNTTYYYKINSGSSLYPTKETLTFRTISPIPANNLQPLVGTVLQEDKTPASEALITLEVPGAQTLATISKKGGNFILPLTQLKSEDLTQSWQTLPASARIKITDGRLTSILNFKLTSAQNFLPPIILGQNQDITPQEPSSTSSSKYDLNGDGIINSLDLSEVLKNVGPSKSPKNMKADLNNDGKVDQEDVSIISKSISKIYPQ